MTEKAWYYKQLGMPLAAIGAKLGISKARVGQLLQKRTKTEIAFRFGHPDHSHEKLVLGTWVM